MDRVPKNPVADISVNTHITVNNKTVSIVSALTEKKVINNIFPDDEVFLVVSQKELLRHLQNHYMESAQCFKKFQFRKAALHRAVATTLKLVFHNFRVFTITGKQYKKVQEDAIALKESKRFGSRKVQSSV